MLFKFFKNQDANTIAKLYFHTVEQARHSFFYHTLKVPDTIDGRFDMIVLHIILILNRLNDGNYRTARFAKRFLDHFFLDLDRNLRELGVSDLSVPKKMKKMAEAFYGRMAAYKSPLLNNDLKKLALALDRNIFPDQNIESESKFLARYMNRVARELDTQSTKEILSGQVSWIDPNSIDSESVA